MPTTVDPNAPATEPDTTVGGGNPGFVGQAYEAPPEPFGPPVAGTVETSDISGGTVHTGIGRTGNTDAHAHDPAGLGAVYTNTAGQQSVAVKGGSEFDTTVNAAIGGIGATGDSDSHSHDPVGSGYLDSRGAPIINKGELDTTVLGGGIGQSSLGQTYVAPPPTPPATTLETDGRAGVLAVNSGSPDALAVGSASGLNPNAVEPTFTNTAYDVHTLDTTLAGAPAFTTVPAQLGTPGAPTGVTVAAITDRAAVTVSWTAPSNAVAKGVVGYIVESNTLGQTEVGKNQTSVEFEQGLIPGDTYTFKVYARTSNGTGPKSTASAPITVAFDKDLVPDVTVDEGLQGPAHTVPGAPTSVAATGGVTQAVITWVAPASNGGSPVTGYEVTASTGQVVTVGNVLTATVTGLSHTAVTFRVKAINVYGKSAFSTVSNSVTPTSVPGAPTIGAATQASSTSVSVAFTAPADNGGSAITSYTAVSTPGGLTQTGASSPLVVAGLTTGTAYTFKVKAHNANGDSALSAASNAVTPT